MLSGDLDNLKFGDIIWCIRENNHCRRIPGHEQGPYIYLYHDEEYVYTLYGTKYRAMSYYPGFVLGEDILSTDGRKMFKKKGLFYLTDIYMLEKENVKLKVGSLPEDKIKELSRTIRIYKPNEYEKIPYFKVPSNNYISEGDIFEHEGNVYISISEEEDCFFGIRVTIYDDGNYKFHIEELEIFEKDLLDYNLLGYIDSSRLKKLKDACKVDENKDKSINNVVSVGNVIVSNGKTYYVSAIDSDFYLCYPLELSDFKNCDINCNKMYFKISFDQEIIHKDSQIDICCSFSKSDIKHIHSMKSEQKKNSKERIDPYAEAREKRTLEQRLRDVKYNFLTKKEIVIKYFGFVLHLFRKPDEMFIAHDIYRQGDTWMVKCIKLDDFTKGIINIMEFKAPDLVVSKVRLMDYIKSSDPIPVNYANPIYNDIFMNQGLYRFVNSEDIKDEISYIRSLKPKQ